MAKMTGQAIKGQKFTGVAKKSDARPKVTMKASPAPGIHSNGNLAQRVNKQIAQATKKVAYGKKR